MHTPKITFEYKMEKNINMFFSKQSAGIVQNPQLTTPKGKIKIQ